MIRNQALLIDASAERRILDFRPLGFRDVLVLGKYEYTYAHPQLPPHRHDEMIEICVLEKGHQIYCVEGREYPLRGGDVFITYPGEVHGSGGHPENVGALYWVIVRVPRAPQRFLALESRDWQRLLHPLLADRPRKFAGAGQLKPILDAAMAAYQEEESPLRKINLQNLLLRFMLDLVSCSSAAPAARRFPSEPIRRVLKYMDRHLDCDALQLSTLAAMANLSISRFKVRFREEVGTPPAQYLNRRRVAVARHLLRSTDLPVTEIALRVGFSSSQYFATVYKRFTGEIPSGRRRAAT